MNTLEKAYSIFAILFALGLLSALILFPWMRELSWLLPMSLLGLFINVGLMFVVLRDIFLRPQLEKEKKYIWIAVLLICWPAIVVYLVLHGFKTRLPSPT